MNKYDYLILRILSKHPGPLSLEQLTKMFWEHIKEDEELSYLRTKFGNLLTRLFTEGFIAKKAGKGGYYLTKSGIRELSIKNVNLN